MGRDFQINGETMASVKGRSDCDIANLTQLGLSEGPIRLTFEFRDDDITLDAWGGQIPADVQVMLSAINIAMTLIHYDRAILDTCTLLSMGGDPTAGTAAGIGKLGRAGQRLGNNLPRFAPAAGNPSTGNNSGNNYIGLNLTSPVGNVPWRFFFTYLTGTPLIIPLGTEKSICQLNWRCIPYVQDPYNGGLGAYGYQLFDHSQDA